MLVVMIDLDGFGERIKGLMQKNTYSFLAAVLLGSLIFVGCSSGRRNPDGSTRYEKELTEKSLRSGLEEAITDPLITDFLTEFKDGYVFVTAIRGRVDSEITDTMSFSLYLGASQGQMKAAISDVRVNGFPIKESRVATWNQEIAQSIEQGLKRKRNSAVYDVDISEESIIIIWGIYDS